MRHNKEPRTIHGYQDTTLELHNLYDHTPPFTTYMFIFFSMTLHSNGPVHSETSTDIVNESSVVSVGMRMEPLPNTFQALTLNVKDDRSTHFVVSQSPTVVAHPETASGELHSHSLPEQQPPLVFSQFEQHSASSELTDNSSMYCSCGQWNGATVHCASGGPSPECPGCGCSRTTTLNTEEDIVSSFNSLSVSHFGSNSANSLRIVPTTGSHMSCRQQAATYEGRCFDDTTVDDLAGYLDEIMFLPKPMSEMAELMYT